MKNHLLNSYAFNLRYAYSLTADLSTEEMTQFPGAGLENHPAFTLGHLASAAALTVKYLGGAYQFDPKWEQLFRRKGPGDPRKPEVNSALYPSKNTLLEELSRQHDRVDKLIREMDELEFKAPATWRFNDFLPSLGDLIYFMCITHESMHLGQLAGWRRAMNLPSALAKL